MNLDNVITRLRVACPSFAGRVAGAAEFAGLPPNSKVALPAAFVIPNADQAGQQQSQNRYRQTITDRIAIVVVLDNSADRRGQAAVAEIHDIRAELWRALLLWPPGPEYDGLVYEGGQGVDMDAARLYYQFEFSAEAEIGIEDTAQPGMVEQMPRLAGIDVRTDVIDPMYDPNLASRGPDGRIEAGADITLE